jgi:hypothetical protein
MKIKLAELDKLPYYQYRQADRRVVVIFPYWETGEFHLPIPDPEREEIASILKPVAFAKGSYIAKEAADPTIDIHIPIFELVVQRYSFPYTMDIMDTIVSDILNFSAILEKYEIIFRDSRRGSGGFRDHALLIESELELIFYNVRSLYDRLQALIKSIWRDTILIAPSLQKQELPDSFRDVVLYGQDDQVRTAEEITTRYGLPSPIASFYYEQVGFFKLCRAIRNRVSHHGHPVSTSPIFRLEYGFAVDMTEHPFSEFECWSASSLRNSKLGSVRALIAHIANRAIDATIAYAAALESCIALPTPIAPGWHVYTRDTYVPHLHRLLGYVSQPWLVETDQRLQSETQLEQKPA